MERSARDRFIHAVFEHVVETHDPPSVRSIAGRAFAAPSLLYKYFGSLDALNQEARIEGMRTVLGEPTRFPELNEMLGGVVGTEPEAGLDEQEPEGFVENELFPTLHVAWLRRNPSFVCWMFGSSDFVDVIDEVRPGLSEWFMVAGEAGPTSRLALQTIALWVCQISRCPASDLPEILSWASHAAGAATMMSSSTEDWTTLSEAIEHYDKHQPVRYVDL